MSTLHNGLLKAGFLWVDSQDLPWLARKEAKFGGGYRKKYHTAKGDFEVTIIVTSPDGSKLPTAYVTYIPDQLRDKAIPHISPFRRLCYADEDSSDWDPVLKDQLASAIDRQIARTLHESTSPEEIESAYQADFLNYWFSNREAYCFASPEAEIGSSPLMFQALDVTTSSSGALENELVIFDNIEQRDAWIKLRNSSLSGVSGDVVIIRVRTGNLAPESWPPRKLSDIFDWLKSADRSAHDTLAAKIIRYFSKNLTVLLNIENEGLMAFRVRFNDRIVTIMNSHSGNRKNSTKKRRGPKSSTLLPVLRGKYAHDAFVRYHINPIDEASLYLRNRKDPSAGDLKNKRICLIGCGTIGGYVAELLVKVGAGKGPLGRLHLYDNDTYSPGNFGRHRLPARYFGWYKSEALADLLIKDTLGPLNVFAIDSKFLVTSENVKKFDIIIDVTGRPPVGRMLANCTRDIINPPYLIHGFNEGHGRASVVFIDNGQACYGCLKKMDVFSKLPIDREERYSCGSMYTPYDANVSVITAGLVQEATLNTLLKKLPWTYAEHISDGYKTRERCKLKPYSKCAVNKHDSH
ncbi:hypothetical protein ADIMK_3393 [Marinobacterium lacunae]|uniref:Uncharacterized protein n=1 Tax=Marinobacterium lacunae TaxID=1232683 RepID=A0A081FVE7_9GAMM|nr:ThiF family adenylyltransferase [Marinobacterium lacunae]KEA62502.1 hypothetical protein ADIMK_3393 [Marinobacterium lacunae]